MVPTKGQLTFGLFLGGAYALVGAQTLHFLPEIAILAGVIVVLAALVPDIDSAHSNMPQEFGALLAAIVPIALLEYFPELRSGGLARISLIVIACYFGTRIIAMQGIQKVTIQQGMFHSIPAAIIVFELCYLFFYDLFWQDRLFLATAALLGYLGHLFLDASSNFDAAGTAFGGNKKGRPVLKLVSENWPANIFAYACLAYFGYYVFDDLYPHLMNHQTAVATLF